ncbi:hypothetical protein J5U21_01295 [Saccharolobus shibatae]|uniref:Uncharacterized protein n=1 Tax=Saccharolobus shibatae TaxID=2286 RepID=A0A8F5BUN9_9CREN|nr:hypothetical protein J5U21_01295 [Saccharolobus shibatae]
MQKLAEAAISMFLNFPLMSKYNFALPMQVRIISNDALPKLLILYPFRTERIFNVLSMPLSSKYVITTFEGELPIISIFKGDPFKYAVEVSYKYILSIEICETNPPSESNKPFALLP